MKNFNFNCLIGQYFSKLDLNFYNEYTASSQILNKFNLPVLLDLFPLLFDPLCIQCLLALWIYIYSGRRES